MFHFNLVITSKPMKFHTWCQNLDNSNLIGCIYIFETGVEELIQSNEI